MDAKKCDVCGKYYDFYQMQYIDLIKRKNHSACELTLSDDRSEFTWDLCPSCMTEIMKFLHNIVHTERQ